MSDSIKFGDSEIKLKKPDFKKIFSILLLFFVFITALSSFYTIDANENGVILRFGAYSHTQDPGLHFKIPFVDQVYKVRVDYQHKLEYGFRTLKSGVKTEYSRRNFSHESWMLTGNLNIAEVRWVTQYKIKDPVAYLFNVRGIENTIRDVSESVMRLKIGDRSFTEVMQTERIAIADKARTSIQEVLDKYNSGILIQLVQLQGVTPPTPVADSFNEVNRAKQEQETLINEARQEYNKEIYSVQGKSQKIVNEAEGYSVERINKAKGDTELFEMILKEYKKAPQITKDRYYIETMNEVLAKVKNKIIVDSNMENILPLLNIQKEGAVK